MDKDHDSDTLQMEVEANRWAETQADDVFDPGVRVMLNWRDVENAVERGAVVPAQAHALWAGWASQSSPQRVEPTAAAASAAEPKSKPTPMHMPAPAPALPVVQQVAATPKGSSAGVLIGLTVAGALAGALVSYLVFAP